jgi:hypothetical protein
MSIARSAVRGRPGEFGDDLEPAQDDEQAAGLGEHAPDQVAPLLVLAPVAHQAVTERAQGPEQGHDEQAGQHGEDQVRSVRREPGGNLAAHPVGLLADVHDRADCQG